MPCSMSTDSKYFEKEMTIVSPASRERAAIHPGEVPLQDARMPRLVPLHQKTIQSFEMLRKDSEGWFLIYIEPDQQPPLHTRSSRRSRCSSADNVQHMLGCGYHRKHEPEHEIEYSVSASSRGRRRSQFRSQKRFDKTHYSLETSTKGDQGFAQEYSHFRPRRKRWSGSWNHGSAPGGAELKCYYCGTTETPQWRRGPGALLCNFCGLLWDKRYNKRKRKKRSCSH
ncbi:hypothetical protein CC79DRAFT_1151914 [Sarocladium strictum]